MWEFVSMGWNESCEVVDMLSVSAGLNLFSSCESCLFKSPTFDIQTQTSVVSKCKKLTGTISSFSSQCVWCFVFTTMCIHVACMVLHWEATLAVWHCCASSAFTCIVDRLFHLAQLEFDVHVLKVLGAQSWFKLPCGPHTPFPGFPNPGRVKGKKRTAHISNAGVPQGCVLPPLRLNTNDFQTSAKSHLHVLMTQFQLFVESLRARSAKSGVQIVIGYPEIR